MKIIHVYGKWYSENDSILSETQKSACERMDHMKGYTTASGYMGYVNGEYILFASEADYLEYMAD